MREQEILENIESLLENLSIDLRYERGDFSGGLYRYKDRRQIIINRELELNKKINILAKELQENVDLENMYIVPALREVIDNAGGLE